MVRAPRLLLALAGLSACGRAPSETLEVYAAASLREALSELAVVWERGGGLPLALNFGGSGALARQIRAARRADVFLSAGELEMDDLERAGLVLAGTRRSIGTNRLVVIEPAARESLFRAPFEPRQLAAPELERLSLANPEAVPAGRYARAWLAGAGLWAELAPRVAPAPDVRAALAAVESGVARAGLVYASDAAITPRVRVLYEVPPESAPAIRYPAAALAGRPREETARAFLEFLAGDEAAAVFARFGFRSAAAGAQAGG